MRLNQIFFLRKLFFHTLFTWLTYYKFGLKSKYSWLSFPRKWQSIKISILLILIFTKITFLKWNLLLFLKKKQTLKIKQQINFNSQIDWIFYYWFELKSFGVLTFPIFKLRFTNYSSPPVKNILSRPNRKDHKY